jgi:hypothetical protein
MVDEIRKARNPIVTVDFIKGIEGHYMTDIYMVIANKGLSLAKDINLSAECKIQFYQLKLLKGTQNPRYLV